MPLAVAAMLPSEEEGVGIGELCPQCPLQPMVSAWEPGPQPHPTSCSPVAPLPH